MRIAVAAHSATRAGGVESYLAAVVPALARSGHDVACWFESVAPGAEPILDARPGPVWIAAPGAGAGALQALREWRPDVIYLHGLRSTDLEAQLTTIAPVVFFAHSYYGACISGDKTTRVPVASPCDRAFGPACLGRYFPLRCGGWSPLTMVRQYAVQRRKEDLLQQYNAVLVASGHMRRQYAAQGVDARVVALPVSREDAGIADRGPEDWSLLYLGRLERTKGVDVAVRSTALAAARSARPVRLTIAGEGSLARVLRKQAEAASAACDRLTVDFRGWLTAPERRQVLARADLLLVPSLWPEPFGLVGVEAAAAGVPAVAFRAGGVEDWLLDGVTGRSVAVDDPDREERFADAIVDVLGDPAALEGMRAAAAARARQFTMAAHLTALEPVLLHAAAGGCQRRPPA